MHIELVTPDQKVFEGEVDAVTFPGMDGSFQVLNNHAPLISALREGEVVVQHQKNMQQFRITGGVVEVLNNHVIVLAESLITDAN